MNGSMDLTRAAPPAAATTTETTKKSSRDKLVAWLRPASSIRYVPRRSSRNWVVSREFSNRRDACGEHDEKSSTQVFK